MVDKRTGHEPSLRIPLVVRYPSLINAGRVIDAQTLTLDFASSILEICNAKPLPTTQGKSWKKLVTSGDSDWRTSWYYEYNYEKQFPYTPNVRALRTDKWKYIRGCISICPYAGRAHLECKEIVSRNCTRSTNWFSNQNLPKSPISSMISPAWWVKVLRCRFRGYWRQNQGSGSGHQSPVPH